MEIKDCREADAKEWDELVSGADNNTIFHTWDWLKVVRKHWKGRFHAVMGVDNGEPIALLPIFEQKRMGFKLLFSPGPRTATPYLGPLLRRDSKISQSEREKMHLDFQSSFQEYLTGEIRPDYIFLLTPPGLADVRPWQWGGYSASPLYEYVLDPKLPEEELWNNLKRNLRNEIKQTIKAGVEVRIGGRKDYLGLVKDTKRRYIAQGIKEETSDALLTDLFDALHPKNMRILVAEHKGERVAGIVELLFQDTVISWIGGVRSEAKGIFPNALVHWESIRMANKSGKNSYVEIGANTRHLCKFKRQFNHAPLQYFALRDYPNPLLRVVERGYMRVYKPIRSYLATIPTAPNLEDKDDG
jgi:hypothetical protein